MARKKTTETGNQEKPPSGSEPGAEIRRNRREPVDLGRALVEAFLTNERINQVLLEMIDPAIWRAMPSCSKRRNIATTFAHMHNVRCMRLTMSARDDEAPARLDRDEVTPQEASEALAQSARAMVRLIESALASGGHVPEFRPDVVALVGGALTHDAHHRGQICHWARQLGAPLTPEQGLRMWEWDKRWKEAADHSTNRRMVRLSERSDPMAVPREIEQLLEPYPPEVRALALAARELIKHLVPGATEIADASAKVIGFGYGPGYKDTICTLILSQRGVKVGIARGSDLPDPEGLLQGTGKVHRHVPLHAMDDLKQPGLKQLLEAGLAAWKQRTGSGA